ncbi:hypothetical protein HET73_04415, partial [Wolbachia endosymbiont of Atemnus politus]|nr:hypothetical protein [Wolbachia endosymbiont of Atemnus politus]
AKLLLNAGVDPNRSIHHADPKKKSKLVELCKESIINNPQKQSSGRRWMVIVPALLFSAIGATLAAMVIIPEIAAIGIVATAVLSGIAGAVIGGVVGYLVDVVINQCCGNQQCAT